MSTNSSDELPGAVRGTLHVNVAFDWGEEILLDEAGRLAPAQWQVLPRRPRTPSSIGYRPPPLGFHLGPAELELPVLGRVSAQAEVMVFDFGAVSTALHVPFDLCPTDLLRLAGGLAEPSGVVEAARRAIEPLHQRLRPAILRPEWSSFIEEYFVFHFSKSAGLPPPRQLVERHAAWLAGLLRLEAGPLSQSEVAEAVRLHLDYSPADLMTPEWAAAILIDDDCDETLRTIEFANVQLLEYRHIDQRLDDRLSDAYRLIHPLTRSWQPLWRTHARQLRTLGELRVEANGLFERTGNALKLVGDPYLARVYRMLSQRFYLETWAENIRRSLDVLEGLYEVMSDQTAKSRAELLELIIIALIAFEIVVNLWPG